MNNMNKMRVICYDMCNYSFGIQKIVYVLNNTDTEIINKLIETDRHIITEGARRSIKVIRDKIVDRDEYVKIFIEEALIYQITVINKKENNERYVIRAKMNDTVMEIKKLIENKIKKEIVIMDENNEIMDVNRTLNIYFNNKSHNNILFVVINNEINYNEDNKEEKKEIKKKDKKKEKIPKAVRMKLWRNYNGNSMDGSCECCKVGIDVSNFDCGHIISEYNGGRVHLENLKPICRMCNSSMGRENMDEFMRKYGFIKNEFKE